jgi:hypothetical protein
MLVSSIKEYGTNFSNLINAEASADFAATPSRIFFKIGSAVSKPSDSLLDCDRESPPRITIE